MTPLDNDAMATRELVVNQPIGQHQVEHLATIVDWAQDLRDAERGLYLAVEAAREDPLGPSWAMIGAALGISQQAACQRFVEPPIR